MKIALVGKFVQLSDEEYIARSFEMIGHTVKRIPIHLPHFSIREYINSFSPNLLIYSKWDIPKELNATIQNHQRAGMKTVCWIFDLYFDYHREFQVKNKSFFKSDYVFSTDDGHQQRFQDLGINHRCVRQGIYKPECILLPVKPAKYDVVFVGSDNPIYPERSKIVKELGAAWFGAKNTNEVRDMALNELYSESKIVIGDSYYSPHYWSNRVVETLGRGGFLIHQDVPGLKEAYPHLVTYKKGDVDDLKSKIKYYSEHEEERRALIQKNFEWVQQNYTMDKMCSELLSWIK